MTVPSILWLRRDLRLADQAALLAACSTGPVVPIYVLDDATPQHCQAKSMRCTKSNRGGATPNGRWTKR